MPNIQWFPGVVLGIALVLLAQFILARRKVAS